MVLGLFVLSVIPGFLTTQLNPYGISKVLGFLIATVLMLAPSAFSSAPAGAWAMLKALTTASGASAILLLLTGTDFVAGRVSLFGLNPIGVARLTGLFVVLALSMVLLGFPRKPYQRVVLLALIPFAILATISTGSRGPLLASGVAILTTVLVVMMRRRARPGLVFLVTAVSGATAILIVSSGAAGLDRVAQGSDSGRWGLFGSTFQLVLANPLGIGWGNLAGYLPDYAAIDGFTLYPHNFFLELAVEGGIIALVGGTCLLFVVFRRLWQSARLGRSAVAPLVLAFLVYGVVNSLLSSDIVGNRMMWLAIGLGLVQFGTSSKGEGADNLLENTGGLGSR